MLKNITINLNGPICRCEELNLGWGITFTEVGICLVVHCLTCKTQHEVPTKVLKAYFNLDLPYPSEPNSNVMNVIPFNPPKAFNE